MSARKKAAKKRRKRRRNELDEAAVQQLRNLGFSQQQIDDVARDINIDEVDDEPFAVALELLLNRASQPELADTDQLNHNHHEPPRKRQRINEEDDSDDVEVIVINSSEEEKTSQTDGPKKKTHVEIEQEEFNQKKAEMDDAEQEFKKWQQTQAAFKQQLSEIRDHIQTLYDKRPNLPPSKVAHDQDDNKNNNNAANVETDDLLTERVQLLAVIDYAYDAMKQHLNVCNQQIDAHVMKMEVTKQKIEDERYRFEQSVQEFESKKYALELMQHEVKSGKNVMTLLEHNLFIVASAMNNTEDHIDNEHFKDLHNKIKALQNRQKSPKNANSNSNTNVESNSNSNSNSNSKEENDDEDENEAQEESQKTEEEKVEFECQICFCAYTELSDILIFDECYHYYCMECLKSTLRVKLQDRNVRNVQCPHDKCEHRLTHQEIQYILNKEEFAKYDQYLLDKTLQTYDDCRRCPGVDCGVPMFGYKDSPMLTCPKCSKQFCFNCGTGEWHQGVTCDAFKRWKQENGQADVKFDEWVKNQNARQCPKCQSFIEKNGGCDHMTCRNCKYEFHWVTGEKWKGYGARYRVPQNQNNEQQNQNQRGAIDAFNWLLPANLAPIVPQNVHQNPHQIPQMAQMAQMAPNHNNNNNNNNAAWPDMARIFLPQNNNGFGNFGGFDFFFQ